MTGTALVFLDTETTGLRPDDEVWEVAAIIRRCDGTETRHHWFVRHDQAKAIDLPEPFRHDHGTRYRYAEAVAVGQLVVDLSALMPPAEGPYHVVGMVPSFDTGHLARLFRRIGVDVPWHHHLIDAETYAAGHLGLAPPFDSEYLSRFLGVDPDGYSRHTAMGDAEWARDVYDAASHEHRPAWTAPDLTVRHPGTAGLLRFFASVHLPPHLAAVSAPFQILAYELVGRLEDGPELTTALRKLLESKDCAVRAALPVTSEGPS